MCAVWRLPCSRLDRKVNRFVDVLYPHDRQDRHHQLGLHKRVVKRRFTDDAAHVLAHLHTDLIQQNIRIAANALPVDHLAHLAGFLILLLDEDNRRQFISLLGIDQVGAVLLHIPDQVIRDIIKREDLLFRDAGQVIVERAAVNDILARLADVGGIVNDDRRIAGAGADRLFAGGQHRTHHAGAARCIPADG